MPRKQPFSPLLHPPAQKAFAHGKKASLLCFQAELWVQVFRNTEMNSMQKLFIFQLSVWSCVNCGRGVNLSLQYLGWWMMEFSYFRDYANSFIINDNLHNLSGTVAKTSDLPVLMAAEYVGVFCTNTFLKGEALLWVCHCPGKVISENRGYECKSVLKNIEASMCISSFLAVVYFFYSRFTYDVDCII